MMTKIKDKLFDDERSLFNSHDLEVYNCRFINGESPLKESKNIYLENDTFEWKYPLWYSKNIKAKTINLKETARSGIWYTDNIEIVDSVIDAPKTFRRSGNIFLKKVAITHADETIWKCRSIKIEDVEAKGDYFGFNSEDITINNLKLDGNYAFDGGKNITITNSVFNSKDAFWNCENVLVKDSIINGEYLGWNSKNVTLVNCTIISHQGMCYMNNVKLENCIVNDSDLIFEYCEGIDATINSEVLSIKNPYSGVIRVKGVQELILDERYCDPNKTRIEIIK